MEIKDFCVAHNIDLSGCAVSLGGGAFTLVELETSPVEFLTLAEEDFQRGGLSALVNATTNAKRAVVSQMDQLLISFGYKSTSFEVPRKLEKLQALGLLAPRLLRKVVKMRNILEHEYKKPSLAAVEEVLDIASLYLFSSSAMFIPFDDVLEFSLYKASNKNSPIKQVSVGLAREAGRVFYTAYVYEGDAAHSSCVGKCEIPSGHPLFDPMVKISASMMQKYKVDQAFRDFETVYATM
ncbi:hypothetical protein [Pseudomonas sp. IT-P260]|uniref:hypothetical protein n=1 Tax=Pseudomonas sp. IT-P260 TaxID=3026457 RepID=UPI0039E1B09F